MATYKPSRYDEALDRAELLKEKSLSSCYKCSTIGALCDTCRIDYYRACQQAEAIGWHEHITAPGVLKYRKDNRADYIADMEYEQEQLEYNTRANALLEGIPVTQALELNEVLQWIKLELAELGKEQRPVSQQEGTSKPIKRPDLKLLALVHALRYESGDKAADINSTNEEVLATAAGARAKSGKDLKRYFTSYATGLDRHAQRLDDGARHTVRERYRLAIALLGDFPPAQKLAEAEREELRGREQL